MNIDNINFPNMDIKVWVMVELLEPGPWQTKTNFKEQLNCLLQFKLSCCDVDTIDIRGYLCNHDSDVVWLNSLQSQVFPFIVKYAPEVYHVSSRC